jgi:hypothetical protein
LARAFVCFEDLSLLLCSGSDEHPRRKIQIARTLDIKPIKNLIIIKRNSDTIFQQPWAATLLVGSKASNAKLGR